LAVVTAQAAVILQDDFSGPAGPADSSKWQITGSPALTGAGAVSMPVPSLLLGQPGYAFAPSGDTGARLTLTPVSQSRFDYIGLSRTDGTYNDVILIRNDGAHYPYWHVQMSSGGVNSTRSLGVSGLNTYNWVINWSAGHVDILTNGAPVLNSDFDAPTDNGGIWALPTMGLVPIIGHYDAGGSPSDVYDSMLWETVVPEPSVAMLLGAGASLLAWRRRDR
jgi:hypothetical protein